MDRQFLVWALIAHVLADFHLQSSYVAENKGRCKRVLFIHAGVVLLLNMLLAVMYWSTAVWIYLLALSAAHLVVDVMKGRISRQAWTVRHPLVLFWGDQFLHLVLILAAVVLTGRVEPVWWMERLHIMINNQAGGLIIGDSAFLLGTKLVLGVLLLTKPSNIIIALSTRRYHYADPAAEGSLRSDDGKAGAGALIGSLERVLSGLFLATGQIAAVGLIFTAKSIARFDRIQKDQRFAEYYLIGSLSSLLICFVVYLFMRYVL